MLQVLPGPWYLLLFGCTGELEGPSALWLQPAFSSIVAASHTESCLQVWVAQLRLCEHSASAALAWLAHCECVGLPRVQSLIHVQRFICSSS